MSLSAQRDGALLQPDSKSVALSALRGQSWWAAVVVGRWHMSVLLLLVAASGDLDGNVESPPHPLSENILRRPVGYVAVTSKRGEMAQRY